ncbi:MAG TPA: sigma-54 dependent transcriptional regulator [Vicinamibacteria bacterium]|nr:sigma-54 dependent transcriptional regulator [Vicinamibacteria bacterium]
MKKILVVDDEPSMRELLAIMLRREGFGVEVAESRAAAARILATGPFDLVITDVKLPDGDGIEILRHLKAAAPETVVIVMTAYGSTETAVAALKLGAQDYLVKPFDVEELKIVVRKTLDSQQLQEENLLLKAEFRALHRLDRMVGVSPKMVKVFELVRSIASTTSTVLIQGESGTGKELVAKAIHALSPRRNAPFVSVNCAALPEPLLESELFGHMKGAFTDAHQTRKGLFETAHHGTLLLDEVGEMALSMQVKLLRALQEKRVLRVGSAEEIDVDVRVIAATNRPLEQLVRDRQFREDLYYRLNVIPILVPPLRHRAEDIPLLAEHFRERFSRETGKAVSRIASETMDRLVAYHWPGNVRELENVIERAMALETAPAILVERLPEALQLHRVVEEASADESPRLGEGFDLDAHLKLMERRYLDLALEQAGGSRPEAARLLGITPRSLRYLLRKHAGEGRSE